MSQHTPPPSRDDAPEPTLDERAAAQPQTGEPADGELTPEDRAMLEAQQLLAEVQRERDDLESRLLRMTADYQNYVRRANQNAQVAREQQIIEIAKALAPVIDHFDRALEVDPETVTPASMLQGVRIVYSDLLKALEQFGVQRLDAQQGDEFDPARHEAMLRQAVEGIEPNRVAQQFQPGYILGDKTIRPAKVSVTE